MAKTRLEVSFGPDFSETRTLTWKHDGLIFLPTTAPRFPTVRTSSYAQAWVGHDFIGNLPHHLLWFTVYRNDNTSFLDRWGDHRNHKFLIDKLIYTVGSVSHTMGRHAIPRYYIQMLTIGIADE